MTARMMVTKLSTEFGFDLEAAFKSLGLEESRKLVPMLGGSKVKRAQSAYMYFANHRRPELQGMHPDKKVTELSKIIGGEWKALAEADKEPWARLAAEDKERHRREMSQATMEPEAPKRRRKAKTAKVEEPVPEYSCGGEEESKGSEDDEAPAPKAAKNQAKPKAASMLKVVLPYCGALLPDCACTAVRKNHGLYTQCTMPRLGGETLCKTCHRTMETKGCLPYGLIADREEMLERTNPKVARYSTVMRKLNISKATAVGAAAELGWTIPESEFEAEAPKARGRPKKAKTAMDPTVESTDSEASGDEKTKTKATKKKAGRPKGKGPRVTSSAHDAAKEKIDELLRQADERDQAEAAAAAADDGSDGEALPESDGELEEEEVEDVTEFAHDGVTYYRGADGALYDPETEECVGKWDGEKVVPVGEAYAQAQGR